MCRALPLPPHRPPGRRAGHRWDVGLMRIRPNPRDGERRAVTSAERSRFAFARPARNLSRPLSGSRAVLAPDGSAAHAVLADVKAQRMSLWSSSGAQVVLDIPIYFAGFDQPASRFVPGGPVFDLAWRGGTTLLTRTALVRGTG